MLFKTYGGVLDNPNIDSCYYCYTIYDVERKMYYSGVKTRLTTPKHGLLTEYFTSSSVTDFRTRLVDGDGEFKTYIEYFATREEAFRAEYLYHVRYDVGNNKSFYNAINATGSYCGAGSVLCRKENGDIYRVSCKEYENGKHKHISAGKMNVIVKSTGKMIKIDIDSYDETEHIKELDGMVHAINLETGESCRITKDEFDNTSSYVGVTTGNVACYDIKMKKMRYVSKSEFDRDSNLVGTTNKLSPWYEKDKLKGTNKGYIVVYSIVDKKNVRIRKETYNKNKRRYIMSPIKQVYIQDNKIYTNKIGLDKTKNYSTITKRDFLEKLPNIMEYEKI